MKKLKKLFKFIPVICLSVISCLCSVLTSSNNVSSSYAESNVLISSHIISDYHLNFVDSANSGLTWDWVFDYEINFYQDISQNRFYFVLNIVNKMPQWSFTYGGVTKYCSFTENQNETIVGSSMTLNPNTFNSTLSFSISSISTNSSINYYGQEFSSWVYACTYRIQYRLAFPSNSGFSPYISNLISPVNPDYSSGHDLLLFRWDTQPSSFSYNANSPYMAYAHTIDSYGIDYTRSNYDLGYNDGYSAGFNNGYNNGYTDGFSSGTELGYNDGYTAGVESQQTAIDSAYNDGYSAGYTDGFSVDSVTGTIFSGILQIGMLPVNVLLAIFNFEILGINIAGFVSAILTVCLTIIVIRTVTGKKE